MRDHPDSAVVLAYLVDKCLGDACPRKELKRNACPDWSESRLQRVLDELRRGGWIERRGRATHLMPYGIYLATPRGVSLLRGWQREKAAA